ncbi:hypothetical protein PoB_005316600 [Plakobranchus ocellatus]|uniref:Uncharacterized protein n=1 Tax=Plakobranchus ocellatus TaxID=259542 RepID=A0AAV4C1M3_9GAST|nr:hypothetical protein PoB_005316600 [Plakobranchus ocellatus]
MQILRAGSLSTMPPKLLTEEETNATVVICRLNNWSKIPQPGYVCGQKATLIATAINFTPKPDYLQANDIDSFEYIMANQ